MEKHRHNPDKCTACTTCTVHCPVSAATRDFNGPKLTGPALTRFRYSGQQEEPSLEYCSNCKNCDISCPSGVPVSTLNMLAKGEYYRGRPHKLRDWILAHGETMAKLASPLAPLSNFGTSLPLTKAVLKKIGIASQVPLPRYSFNTFAKRFKNIKQQPYPDKVVFFPGCYVNYNDPQTGVDLVAVMQANKIEVILPEGLKCCGCPTVSNGFLDEAGDNATANIKALKKWVDQGYPVIACCPSCTLMLKQEYGELFDLPDTAAVAARVYDAAEYLLELEEQGKLNTQFAELSGRYIYHAPCHLRAQGIGRPSLEILQKIPGIEIEDADAGCCGISGSYGFKDDRYEIAMQVGSSLFEAVKASGVATVLTDCGTCRVQIEHGTGVKTLHPMSIIRQAYEGGKRK